MGYYCPIYVTTHGRQQQQGTFSPFRPRLLLLMSWWKETLKLVFDFGVSFWGDHVLSVLPLSKAKLLLYIPAGVFG